MTARSRPRLMPVVVTALLALALLKALDFWVGFASAGAAQEISATEEESGNDVALAPPGEVAPPLLPANGAERRLLERLADRRAELDEREAALDTREQLLGAAERRIEDRFAALAAEEAALEEIRTAQTARRTEDYAALSNAYARMRPRDAARIFDVLDETILVPVAAGMRTQSLSGVLAEMEPDKARRLTLLLAEEATGAPAGSEP